MMSKDIKFEVIWFGEKCAVSDIQWFKDGRLRRVKVFYNDGDDNQTSNWLYLNDGIVLEIKS